MCVFVLFVFDLFSLGLFYVAVDMYLSCCFVMVCGFVLVVCVCECSCVVCVICVILCL